jgi:quercetin 2,3-dioxygenase
MIKVRKSEDRGHAKHGWLESYHTFSFANYQDPQFDGFRDLLVINEDWIQPGQGFGKHPHEDMEIVTYVVDGLLSHRDSMGNGSTLKYGDIQRMSAGTGVIHSEFNGSKEETVHLLQIWIVPGQKGVKPGYEEKTFSQDEKKNTLRLIVSPDGKNGSVKINQKASVYSSILDEGKSLTQSIAPGRNAWIQVIKGALTVNGTRLEKGDGAAISQESKLEFKAAKNSEFLLFDLN